MDDKISNKRLKVLISAYACEPNKGSEPGVGWNFVTTMAKYHDLTVLTRSNNKKIIAEYLNNKPVHIAFVYHDLPKWASWWKKGNRGIQLYYYLWQLTAIPIVKRCHRKSKFDLCQHVTFVKYWVPSCLAWLGIPFIWGPVGGGDSTAKGFLKGAGLKGIIYELARNFTRKIAVIDPLLRFTAKSCSMNISVTKKTLECVKKLNRNINSKLMTQVGITSEELKKIDETIADKKTSDDTIFLFAGNLLFLKGIHLGISAFAKCKYKDSQFWIVGDGPERKMLEQLARGKNIDSRVHFLGNRTRDEVWKLMKSADIIVHPSLHDSGGFVPVEAMACRRPIICLDTAGPSILVPEGAGCKIAVTSQDETIAEICKSMNQLADSIQLRYEMGESGRKYIEEHLLWQNRISIFSQIYSDVTKDTAKV